MNPTNYTPMLEPFLKHPTPMLVVERKNGDIVEGNEAVQKLLGLTPASLPGASIFALGRLAQDDLQNFARGDTPRVLRMYRCSTKDCAQEIRISALPVGQDDRYLLCTMTNVSDICMTNNTSASVPDHCLMSGTIPAVLFQVMIESGKITFTFLTENVSTIFGVERDAIMKDARSIPIHPEDIDALWESISDAATQGQPWKHECRAIKPDGDIVWWRGEANLYLTSGTRSFYNGLILNVGTGKEVEQALRRQARLLQAVSDTSTLLLDSVPTDQKISNCLALVGRRLRVQRTCLYEITYSHETEDSFFSLLNRWSERSEWEYPPKEDLQDIPFKAGLSRWYDHFRLSRPVRGDIRDFPEEEQVLLKSFGTTSLMAIPIMRGGSCWGFLCLNDMDRARTWREDEAAAGAAIGNALAAAIELGRTLEKLRETENLYRSIFEDSPAGIFQATPTGRYIHMNPAMAHMHGYSSPEEMMEITGSALYKVYVSPEDADYFMEALRERRTIEDREVLTRKRDGSTFWTSRTIHPMVDEYGEVTSVDGFVVDITERKKADVLREEIEQITRHDLKTPLSGFISVPQVLLMSNNLTDEQRELVEAMLDSGRRMLRLINISLDLYKLEQGTYELTPSKVDLLQLAVGLEHELRHICHDQKKTMRVLVDGQTPPKGTSFIVSGEELLLYSMLANLLKNALEASPKGAEVTMNMLREGSDTIIEIHNQGAVPERIRETFFDKLSTSGKAGGTGLGTYSAKLLAEAHSGNISMSTSDALGTTIRIRLPPDIQS